MLLFWWNVSSNGSMRKISGKEIFRDLIYLKVSIFNLCNMIDNGNHHLSESLVFSVQSPRKPGAILILVSFYETAFLSRNFWDLLFWCFFSAPSIIVKYLILWLIHCPGYSVGSFNLEIHVLLFKKIFLSYFFDFFCSVSETSLAQILNLLNYSSDFFDLSYFLCSSSLPELPQFSSSFYFYYPFFICKALFILI